VLYAITHRTSYAYAANVSISHHIAYLRPRELPGQQVNDYRLLVEPHPVMMHERIDFYGNMASLFSIELPHRKLQVTSHSRVQVFPPVLPVAALTPPWEHVRKRCSSDRLTQDSDKGEFLFDSPLVKRHPMFADYASSSFPKDRPLLEGLFDLTHRIYSDFKFDPRATTVATPLSEVFSKRRGVCQDFAHLAIAALRSLGLPARYVSGYLETQPMPGKARLIGADASHAWVSAWCPGYGWIDADPTNNLLPGDRHVTLAWGRDFSDVAPLHGVVTGGGHHGLTVSVDVAPLGTVAAVG
jgi:transglutaminase-like putative cysteine protease